MVTKTSATAKKAAKTPGTTRQAPGRKRAVPNAAGTASPVDVVSSAIASGAVVEVVPVLVIAKPKLVRDSFTMPDSEYQALNALKLRFLQLSRSVKKGELIRAGVFALTQMSDDDLIASMARIPSLKTGRPKNIAKSSKKKS